jgi:hypothetical protein
MPPDAEAVAEQVFTALARDWDGPLGVLQDHLGRSAHGPGATSPHETG